jgi:hypothetical protein
MVVTNEAVVLSDVLYGCNGLCLSSGRMFENRVLGRMFGPKRNEATGGWVMGNSIICTLH